MHIQTPVLTPCRVPTEALTLSSFNDSIEVANFRFDLTGQFFELVTTSFFYGGRFWSGDDEAAIRGVGAGCCVCGVALTEKEAFTFSACELDKHEKVTV